MAVTYILAFIGILTIVSGQVNFPGKCPNVTTQSNFDIQKYAGLWYEIEKYPTIFQNGAGCLKAKYTPGKNNTFHVENFMSLYGYNLTVSGIMQEVNPNLKDGKLNISLPSVDLYNSEVWVVSTNYTDYAIVWYCNQLNNSNDQFAWTLSRTPSMSEAQHASIIKILDANHIIYDKFLPVNQTRCGKRRPNSAGNSTRVSLALIIAALFTTLYNLC